MKELLKIYLNSEIGVNIIKPLLVDSVTLIAVHEDYFTVKHELDGNTYHLPFLNIVKIIENPDGVSVGGIFRQKKKFPMVIKIGHLVDYMPS